MKEKKEYVWKPIVVREDRQIVHIEPGKYYNKDIDLDPNGFFLIKINKETKEINCAWCDSNFEVTHEFISKSAFDLMKHIMTLDLVTKLDHAAYLGFELQKAFNCIKHGTDYMQD